jgi:ferredoxin-NADP reductase
MHTLALRSIEPVTHDTHHLVFPRPKGFAFSPGQASELALDRDGWRDEWRPFTFVSDPDGDTLEFIIKSYPEHDGVTERIGRLSPGAQVRLKDPFGAIRDQGPGVFIAGGAGITPFIAILRERARRGSLDGCTLIFSNRCERDIILRQEFETMHGLVCVFTLTDEDTGTLPHRKVDGAFLDEVVKDYGQTFYLCGPHGMVDDVREALKARGASDLVVEKGW